MKHGRPTRQMHMLFEKLIHAVGWRQVKRRMGGPWEAYCTDKVLGKDSDSGDGEK